MKTLKYYRINLSKDGSNIFQDRTLFGINCSRCSSGKKKVRAKVRLCHQNMNGEELLTT
jgi:hypothetical protein